MATLKFIHNIEMKMRKKDEGGYAHLSSTALLCALNP